MANFNLPPEDQGSIGIVQSGADIGDYVAAGWSFQVIGNLYVGTSPNGQMWTFSYSNGKYSLNPYNGGSAFGGSPFGGTGSSSSSGGFGGSSGGGGGGGGGAALGLAYQHLASAYGMHLDASQISALISGQVSIDEFHQRLMVTKKLHDNQTFFDQFAAEAKRAGLANAWKTQDSLDFILGRKPGQFYDLWNVSAGRTAFEEAGVGIGDKGDQAISRHELVRIQKDLGLTGPEGAGQDFSGIASQYAQLGAHLPTARFLGAGITERERERWSEGKASIGTLTKIQRMLDEEKLLSQPTATTQFQPQRGQAQPQY